MSTINHKSTVSKYSITTIFIIFLLAYMPKNMAAQVSVSGTVYIDNNSLTGGIDAGGTGGGTWATANQLYVNAVKDGLVIARVTVNNTGVFTFPAGGALTTGDVVTFQLSNVQGTVGAAPPQKTLPTGWGTVGESTTSGPSDGTPNNEFVLTIPGTNSPDNTTNLFGITQQSYVDVGVGFLPNKTYACGRTMFAVDMRYVNLATSAPAVQLQNNVTITLPAGVTVVSGGVQGYNTAGGTWTTPPSFSTTANSITINAGAVLNDNSNSNRGTQGYIYVEVQVCNAGTVTLPANSFNFVQTSGTLYTYTNPIRDVEPVSIAHTTNPTLTKTCQSLDIGILLDGTGSMSVPEREQIITGIKGLLDDLEAHYANGLVPTPFRLRIGKFATTGGFAQFIDLTEVTAANRPLFDNVLRTDCGNPSACYAYENTGTNWNDGLTNFNHTGLDVMFFFTDGTPNAPYNEILQASDASNDFVENVTNAYDAANAIKAAGVRLFTIINDEEFFFTSGMDAAPATPYALSMVKSLTNGANALAYTNDFKTQDYYVGPFSGISNFFNSVAANICSTTPIISGNVFNDDNGLNDTPTGIVNGSGTNAGGLNAILYNNTTEAVVAVVPVNADGSYTFPPAVGGNTYSVYITTATATVGQPAPPVVTLPAGWVSTGEQNCENAAGCTGSDGTANGILSLGPVNNDITEANFGIERTPNSDNVSQNIPTPTGNAIPAGTITTHVSGSDPEDGVLGNSSTFTVTQLPSNATMLYNGIPVTVNQTFTNFNPALLSFTGISNGSTNIVFNYAFTDAAGVPDPTPATYTIIWSTALPIVLNNFYATAITCNKAQLNWEASNAVNFIHFEIEKSVDGMSYYSLATVAYNEMESKYSFYDNQLSSGNTYYRLKLVDIDGTFKYSKITFITSNCNSKNITVFPNPLTNDVLNITGLNGKVQLQLCDISGKIISRQTAFNYQERIDMAGLSSGIYILKVIDKNGRLIQSMRVNKLK